MKLTVQVQLLPDSAQRTALGQTLALANRAANLVSESAWQRGVFRTYDLQKLTYGEVRALGLSAQPAVHVIKKVADAYKLDRRTKRGFRADAAHPYDDRCLSWQLDQGTVSIWTVGGRLKGMPFVAGDYQRKLLAHRKGESDLVVRDGKWYLYATCEVPEAPTIQPNGFLGVDLGIVNIATTSDGNCHAGKHLNRVRHRNQRLRTKLQKKATKSAKRLLKKRRAKKRGLPPTPTTSSPNASWPRLNAPAVASPWKTSKASAAGAGSASPSGPRCTLGRFISLARSSATRPRGLG